jgi:type II secretory ATPase GspE/PulE/Tfp pilus assembly ATPase PilB-like protein
VDRLVQMGVEPFLVAASIRGVLAQRLVRMLCEKCKRPHKATQAEAELLGQLVEGGTFFDPVGCGSCLQTGYTGRHPVHEWLGTSRPVRELILARQSADRISEQARAEGMRDLMEDALEKAAKGITSIAEALRVTRLSADL